MQAFNYWLVEDIGGGPRPWKMCWIISFQKISTALFLGLLMWWYADKTSAATSVAAWTFLAMHGKYGFIWLGIFAVNITCKEASMARYPQWSAFTRNSWLLIPRAL